MPIIGALEVDDIRRHLCDGDVIEAFIKPGMGRNFDMGGFRIMPQRVACSARDAATENTFVRVGFQLCRLATWGSDPHKAAKSANVGEVFLLACRASKW